MFGLFRKLFGGRGAGRLGAAAENLPPPGTLGVRELARRLGCPESGLRAVPVVYSSFVIPKRSGGERIILAPAPPLKHVQRRLLRRVLAGLDAHACATGFERGHSIVTNALPHVGKEVVVRLDLRNFFTATRARRVEAYFRVVGWDAEAAQLLTWLCTHRDGLPQGAPTSPRLANLVNYRLDARLLALAETRGASYSRYADDLTFSARALSPRLSARGNPKTLAPVERGPGRINDLVHAVKEIVRDEGYELHTAKKLRIMRSGDRQAVTGLVVNEKVNLPRSTRRWLRAVEHRLREGRPATLTAEQFQGWQSLAAMVREQASG